MSLCDRCGNYPNICGCEDVDVLSARLSRHEHWIADLTREAESLLSFIDGKEKVPPEVSEEDKAHYRALPVVPDMEHEPVSVIHQISDAKGLGKMATPGPVPASSEAALHWIQSTPEI